jgi:hypothetical protein
MNEDPRERKQDPAEIENLEVTELEDEDIEDVSGGVINGNCPCSET